VSNAWTIQAPGQTTNTGFVEPGSTSMPTDMTDAIVIPSSTSTTASVVIPFPGVAEAVSPCRMMLMLDFFLVVTVYIMC